ncbi:hypothetical protein SEA_SAKAI_46 [Arthrobacter phage Sakai]|nr:hypothetical protein SEA_GORPY_47 [Arthrobacter phage Gorpy]UVK61993.1 hypothetical protein SEA_SAKAI_46 [Arthrobacter phage Sakai]
MSARNELTTLILGKTAPRAADAILAAGFRKPRAITTAEELDKLGAKSVILDAHGTPWVCDGDPAQPWASVCEDPQGGPIWEDSEDIALPATVMHEPEAQA